MSYQDIPGWFDWEWLYDEAVERANEDDVIVEIGVAFGKSVAYLARKAIDSGKKLTIYAVDPWVDDWHEPLDQATWGADYADWARSVGGPFSAFVECMRTHAREEFEYINPIRMYSWEFAPALQHALLVFVDGDHRYKPALGDILMFNAKAQILAGHDYSPAFPGVVKAVDEALPNCEKHGTTWVRR